MTSRPDPQSASEASCANDEVQGARQDAAVAECLATVAAAQEAFAALKAKALDLGSLAGSLTDRSSTGSSKSSSLGMRLAPGAMLASLKRMTGRANRQKTAQLSQLVSQLSEEIVAGLTEEVDFLARNLAVLTVTLTQLQAHVEPRPAFNPWFSPLAFDDRFRGSREEILERYQDVADLLAGTSGPVIDLGCGRGELVELLAERNVACWGVEISPTLVDFGRARGLDVRLQDAFSALRSLPDHHLGGVALLQVVEHLSPSQLVDLVPLLHQKLRPGGLCVAETVNAQSPYVFTRAFYLDPTHTNPIPADYLRFVFEQASFSKVEIQWRSEVPQDEKLPMLTGVEAHAELVDQVNRAFKMLNDFLFAPQDYAILATA